MLINRRTFYFPPPNISWVVISSPGLIIVKDPKSAQRPYFWNTSTIVLTSFLHFLHSDKD